MAELFLSYRFVHCEDVAPLVEALRRAGIDVWRDVDGIREADSITETVRDALASTRALAVYATPDYIDSLICTWELVSAWIAGEGVGGATKRVILLRPPGIDLKDVRVGALQDALAFDLDEGIDTVAAKVAEHLKDLDDRSLGELTPLVAEPPWFPLRRDGSNHFVGRWSQLWELHSKLARAKTVGVTGQVGRDAAQVRGLGGVGKSLLAIEYAKRFASAWPGGIFWIEGDPTWASAPDTAQARTEHREALLAGLASALGVDPILGDVSATAAAVVRKLEANLTSRPDEPSEPRRYLWVLDNVPRGTRQALLEALGPPLPGGAMLLTTRWRGLTSLGEHLDLDILAPAAALKLLTGLYKPSDEDELRAAEELAKAVGYHPLALDVLRALVELTAASRSNPFATWTARLADPTRDEFDEAAAVLDEELPTGCARAITQVLVTSLEDLPEAALDILRLASLLAEEPVPGDLLAAVLEKAGGDGGSVFEGALGKLRSRSLILQTFGGKAIVVHALVRRVARRWRCDANRMEGLLRGACEVLGRRIGSVSDIREHGPLAPLISHAMACAGGYSQEAAKLGFGLGRYFHDRGEYASARECLERLLLLPIKPDGPETIAPIGPERLAHVGRPAMRSIAGRRPCLSRSGPGLEVG